MLVYPVVGLSRVFAFDIEIGNAPLCRSKSIGELSRRQAPPHRLAAWCIRTSTAITPFHLGNHVMQVLSRSLCRQVMGGGDRETGDLIGQVYLLVFRRPSDGTVTSHVY